MVTVLPLDMTELVSGEERQLLINFKLWKTSSPTSDGTGFVPAMDRRKLNELLRLPVLQVLLELPLLLLSLLLNLLLLHLLFELSVAPTLPLSSTASFLRTTEQSLPSRCSLPSLPTTTLSSGNR
ncbi:hypothetical protein BLNAU_2332 [Blattamonas nauphoetae]|uniref:Uncharacterized protein n=1 Tax=Blattamonas nauphoetae TaxID=2049346 RepID=A0ABQ9YFF8_9EUKA|nr:hypothetical protein BLNAU_2332 [Blattamonas nauphoetae]